MTKDTTDLTHKDNERAEKIVAGVFAVLVMILLTALIATLGTAVDSQAKDNDISTHKETNR